MDDGFVIPYSIEVLDGSIATDHRGVCFPTKTLVISSTIDTFIDQLTSGHEYSLNITGVFVGIGVVHFQLRSSAILNIASSVSGIIQAQYVLRIPNILSRPTSEGMHISNCHIPLQKT